MKSPKIDLKNTTVVPLVAEDEWVGEWQDVQEYETVTVSSKSDVAGTLYLEFTNNNNQTTADSSLPYEVGANVNEVHSLKRTRQFYRTRYVNGPDAQSDFEVSTFYEHGTHLTAPQNSPVSQDADALATRGTDFSQEVVENLRAGYSVVNKFGRNTDIDTATVPEDVWEGGGVYTGQPVNLSSSETIEIFSSSVNDAVAGSGLRTLRVSGLSETGVEQTEDFTLNGTTPVASTLTWYRVFRAVGLNSGSGNEAFNVGTITIRHTITTANVFAVMPIGTNQTQVACYTVPINKKAYLKDFTVEIARSNSSTAVGGIYVRDYLMSPRLTRIFTISQTNGLDRKLYGGLEYSGLTDIRIRIFSVTANNTSITSSFDLILVTQ